MFMSFAGFDSVPSSSHLELRLQLGPTTPGFLNKILCVFLISPNRAVCPPSHHSLCNKGNGRVKAFIIIFHTQVPSRITVPAHMYFISASHCKFNHHDL
jgi:hypothetical protein